MLKVFWFRKDIRLFDNRALSLFINSIGKQDSFSFIYIKNKNSNKYYGEKRISFLYENLIELKSDLKKFGFSLNILEGKSLNIFKKLNGTYEAIEIFCNEQVEPYCIKRDCEIKKYIESNSGKLNSFQDSTLMDLNKVIKDDSTPYTVFTPFKNKFLELLSSKDYKEYKVKLNKLNPKNEISINNFPVINLKEIYNKLDKSNLIKGGRSNTVKILNNFITKKTKNYDIDRDFPAISGTSLLSAHLHFGTINIRECFRAISKIKNKSKGLEKWRDELIWREFYYNIAYNFPYIENGSFKKEYDNLNWNYDKKLFKLWCDGKTGYPIVDAGMRQLNREGWMHNRVRMIVAMFLTKDLLIDWKLGERYFAENLIDLDFASNNGGWQWSASTGCDAQPYFRIFNPYLQSKRYDPEGAYIKKYISELSNLPVKYIHNPSEMPKEEQKKYGVIIGKDYPAPIINHSEASKFAIAIFKNIKEEKEFK
ncbi:MAG: deoxyribodipyrimidine photo-lyase [Ignavibacteriae bacterium]|nr:deoxyribodipyrimidine photo-lyase [Ignavibacteriota bacterium]